MIIAMFDFFNLGTEGVHNMLLSEHKNISSGSSIDSFTLFTCFSILLAYWYYD